MSTGIEQNSGGTKRSRSNGSHPPEELPVEKDSIGSLISSPKMEDLLSKFMVLTGPQLRAVFDQAIEQNNTRVQQEEMRHKQEEQEAGNRICRANTEIAQHEQSIRELRLKIGSLQTSTEREAVEYKAKIQAIEKERDLIENMKTLFKSRLDGVVV